MLNDAEETTNGAATPITNAPAPSYVIPVAEALLLGGRRRTFAGLEAKEWAFLAISTINILVTVVLTLVRLAQVIANGETKTSDMTFIILILVNAIFFTFYTLNGLLKEREFELYALVCAILVILAYCVVPYLQAPHQHVPLKLARLIVCCILAPPNIALAILVAREFGWLEFRIVGASELLQRMYRETTRFSSLLKFDFQIAVSIVILVLKNGTEVSTYEIIILAVGIPISFLWICLGWAAIKLESLTAVIIFAVAGLLEPAYIIFRLYNLYADLLNLFTRIDKVLLYAQLAACAFALLVRSMVYIELYRVARNFGKGLRERAFSSTAVERTSLLAGPRAR